MFIRSYITYILADLTIKKEIINAHVKNENYYRITAA